MSLPKLTYFNIRGRAEYIRLILAYLKVEYKDERVNSISDELRSKLAFGQLPLYEDGKVSLVQSVSIARYIAKKHDFAGANAIENALCDSYVDSVADAVYLPIRSATDDSSKLKYRTETLPKFLKSWEQNLVKQGGNYFVGKGQTWSDIYIFYGLEYLQRAGYQDVVKQYPAISKFYSSIESIPQISTYLKNRPETKM